jgi:pilus assembly protein CpaC
VGRLPEAEAEIVAAMRSRGARLRRGLTVAAIIIIIVMVAAPQAQVGGLFPDALRIATRIAPDAGTIQLLVGRSAVLDLDAPITRVSLTTPEVADALVTSPSQVLIHGKRPGTISLFVWQTLGTIRTYEVVVERDLSALSERMRHLFPGETISVTGNGSNVVVAGTVSSKYVVEKAADVAAGYVETPEHVVNLLRQQEGLASNQILLRVRFAEVSRTALQELGASFFTGIAGHENWIGRTTTQQSAAPEFDNDEGLVFSDFLNLFFFNTKEQLGGVVRALQTRGLFQSLAEPNLIAQNGKEASFLAGGEFPFPVIQGTGGANTAITIQFKEFGIRLSFTPTVLVDDLIHIKVRPEVSALDFSNGLSFEGFRIPSLTTRRAETELELRDGQTFAIAGLLNNTVTETMSKVPGIGDIPILGLLFRSRAKQKEQTELVVMITPQILRRGSLGAAPTLPSLAQPFLEPIEDPLMPPPPHVPQVGRADDPIAGPTLTATSSSDATLAPAIGVDAVRAAWGGAPEPPSPSEPVPPVVPAPAAISSVPLEAGRVVSWNDVPAEPAIPTISAVESQVEPTDPKAAIRAAQDRRDQAREAERQAREQAKRDAEAAKLAEQQAREQAKQDAQAVKAAAKRAREQARRDAEAAKEAAKQAERESKAAAKRAEQQAKQAEEDRREAEKQAERDRKLVEEQAREQAKRDAEAAREAATRIERERKAAAKQAGEDRREAEKQAERDRKLAEEQAREQAKRDAEAAREAAKRTERERKAAAKQAEEDRREAEKQAERDRKLAEEQAREQAKRDAAAAREAAKRTEQEDKVAAERAERARRVAVERAERARKTAAEQAREQAKRDAEAARRAVEAAEEKWRVTRLLASERVKREARLAEVASEVAPSGEAESADAGRAGEAARERAEAEARLDAANAAYARELQRIQELNAAWESEQRPASNDGAASPRPPDKSGDRR